MVPTEFRFNKWLIARPLFQVQFFFKSLVETYNNRLRLLKAYYFIIFINVGDLHSNAWI